MKKNRYVLLFLIFTGILLFLNITLIIVFNLLHMEDNFYNSLNVGSLVVAFLSLIASSFFSFSVYLQTEKQNKINESLPKKDDQYIIANYSLFNIEKEFSLFNLTNNEKESIIKLKKYLGNSQNDNNITRLVFLPTDSINKPTYKVIAKSIKFCSFTDDSLSFYNNDDGVDCEYSANILQRGYNCICVDLNDDINQIFEVCNKTDYIELELDIISVFNVCMSIKFNIYLNGEKDNENNPDKLVIEDLKTYNIHHTNYNINNKSIIMKISR